MNLFFKNFTKEQVMSLGYDAYMGVSTVADITPEQRLEGMNNLLQELGQNFRQNKNILLAIVEQTISAIVPKTTEQALAFAEVKRFKLGDTPRFKVKNGKIKAYSVALGGTVRRHRKDKSYMIVEVEAIQAKVYEEVVRIQAGNCDWRELINDCKDAIQDEIYSRVYNALIGTYSKLPAANKAVVATTDADNVKAKAIDDVLRVVKSYGNPVIYGTFAALSAIPNLDTSDAAKNDFRNKGYNGVYKGGIKLVELKNPVLEGTQNTKFAITDKYLFIIPEGQEKLVKIGFEGDTYVNDGKGADWTIEFETLTQVGVGTIQHDHIGMIEFTDLA